MNKNYDEKISYTRKMETKKKISTQITIEENDDYIEIVKNETHGSYIVHSEKLYEIIKKYI